MDTEDQTNQELCKCGNLGKQKHPCPYAEDINGDYTSVCNCCDDCIQQCCDDI